MECIPAHKLVEHTFVLTREEATATAQLDTLVEISQAHSVHVDSVSGCSCCSDE
jgi:hypothetical protein